MLLLLLRGVVILGTGGSGIARGVVFGGLSMILRGSRGTERLRLLVRVVAELARLISYIHNGIR